MARNSRGGAIGILLLSGVLLGMTQAPIKVRVWNELEKEWQEFYQVETKIQVLNAPLRARRCASCPGDPAGAGRRAVADASADLGPDRPAHRRS